MLPHAEVQFFSPLCGTETDNYQRKTDVFEWKKKKILLFLEQKTTKKLTLNKYKYKIKMSILTKF